MAARCRFAHSCEFATGSQMPLRFEKVRNDKMFKGNCQTAARCQYTICLELATGNWQSDANSIL